MKIVQYILIVLGLLSMFGATIVSPGEESPASEVGRCAIPDSISFDSFTVDNMTSIYTALDSVVDPLGASQAGHGYSRLLQEGRVVKPIIVLIDLSLTSEQERLFIIDMRDTTIVHRSLVAHGQNSGQRMADTFSNVPNSFCSSRGFYHTAETYMGKHGLSLKLDGLEKGVNDNARKRAIVIHSADYVSKDFVAENGRLGRSLGCPALPEDRYHAVIHSIKEGALLYIHSPLGDYHRTSPIIGERTAADEQALQLR